MLYAGLDLSRQRLDVHVLDEEGRTVEVLAVHPDATSCALAWSRRRYGWQSPEDPDPGGPPPVGWIAPVHMLSSPQDRSTAEYLAVCSCPISAGPWTSPGPAVMVTSTRPEEVRAWTTHGSGGRTLIRIALSALCGAMVSITVVFTTMDTRRSVPLTTPRPIASGDGDGVGEVPPPATQPANADEISAAATSLVIRMSRLPAWLQDWPLTAYESMAILWSGGAILQTRKSLGLGGAATRRVRELDHAALMYSWRSPPRTSRRSMAGTPSASSIGPMLSGT